MVSTRTSSDWILVERIPARHSPAKGLRKRKPGWANTWNRPHFSTTPTLDCWTHAKNKQFAFPISLKSCGDRPPLLLYNESRENRLTRLGFLRRRIWRVRLHRWPMILKSDWWFLWGIGRISGSDCENVRKENDLVNVEFWWGFEFLFYFDFLIKSRTTHSIVFIY